MNIVGELAMMYKKPRDIIPLLDKLAKESGKYVGVNSSEYYRAVSGYDNFDKAKWIRSESIKIIEKWKSEEKGDSQ